MDKMVYYNRKKQRIEFYETKWESSFFKTIELLIRLYKERSGRI